MIAQFFDKFKSLAPERENHHEQGHGSSSIFEEKEISSQENHFDFLSNASKAYMLVRATTCPHMTEDLDLEAYLAGKKDSIFQNSFNDTKAFEFFDRKHPNKKFFGRPYTVYGDLLELLTEKRDRSDLGASNNYSYVLCFEKSPKEVYSDIAKGDFHKAIVQAINYRDLHNWYYRQKHVNSFKGEIIDANEFQNSVSKQNAGDLTK